MPLSFSSSSRNSDGSYSLSSGVQTSSSSSSRNYSTGLSPGALGGTVNSAGNRVNTTAAERGSAYSSGNNTWTNTSSGGNSTAVQRQLEQQRAEQAAKAKAEAAKAKAEAARKKEEAEAARKKAEAQEALEKQKRVERSEARVQRMESSNVAARAQRAGGREDDKRNSGIIAREWERPEDYLNADLTGMAESLVAAGISERDAEKMMERQRGIQSVYQRQYDNDKSLDNATARFKDLSGVDAARNAVDAGKALASGNYVSAAAKAWSATREYTSGDSNGVKAMIDAGNMYREDAERNYASGDPSGVGVPYLNQSNFAFDDTFAGKYKTAADSVAGVADAFIPFINPAQGIVDATQANDSRKALLDEEMSTSDMWKVGVKSAIPGARMLGNWVGAAQYDDYDRNRYIPPEESSNDVQDVPLKPLIPGQQVAANKAADPALENAYIFGNEGYNSHIKGFKGSRIKKPHPVKSWS